MKVRYTASLSQYMMEVIETKSGEDLQCPNCNNIDFHVWFSVRDVVSLTCRDCGNFIHVYDVTED